MASFNKISSFVADVANGVHNLSTGVLKVALTNVAPTASSVNLASITEISYTNCSSRDVTTISSTQTTGLYKLLLTDLVLTASGTVGPFRYIVLYNDTAASKQLLGWYDYGSAITLSTGDSFTIDFSSANGLIQLT